MLVVFDGISLNFLINQASNLSLPDFTYYVKLFNTNLYYKDIDKSKLEKFIKILKIK